MLESAIVAKILRAIRAKYGDRVFAWKEHGGMYGTAGVPDLIVCGDGLFIGLEVKSPDTGYKVSQLQAATHKKIRSAGGRVAVVYSADEAIGFIDSCLEGHRSNDR